MKAVDDEARARREEQWLAAERRAACELPATGVTARARTVETNDVLTRQEAQIARLAGDGLSNQEIGRGLFIGALCADPDGRL
jgi:DNA-binding NarL/FixJ family response regulator